MGTLKLSLLGPFETSLDETPLPGFRTLKTQALLIYLAAEPANHSRESLMTLLWPGMPVHSARHNLRQVIYHLRSAIPELSAKSDGPESNVPLLLTNRLTIQLNPAADVDLDIAKSEELLEGTQRHNHLDLLSCHDCLRDMEAVIDLYRGDFLADFYLDDSNEFEEWSQIKREAYRRGVLDALETLTTINTRQKSYAEARALAERQLEIDNLRESAFRQLMEVMALSGQRTEALALYENCRRILAEELGMAPAARTTQVYEMILAGDLRFDAPLAQGVRGYELQDEIGEGAYGSISRAIQPAIGREVAVKIIRRKYANNPEFIRRFEAEAQTIARLEHPYIVPLYDYWRDPDGAYLVMRYMRGGSLLASLETGQWELEPAMKMLDQVASALSVAHRHGVIHRDIKPANILLDEEGNSYLSDFGIAKDLTGEVQMTAEGAIIGTPDYISPEQIKNEQVSSRTDIYSLGAVLFETLTGEKPFPDTSVANLIYKHLHDPVPLVSDSRPDLPSQIDAVIQRATAKRPADRYADAVEMAEAFRRAARGLDLTQPDTGMVMVPAGVDILNPYKGLRPFQESDADDFYGRETLVSQLIARLAHNGNGQFPGGQVGRFLAVVGPSGSGKSSAVKAGLIPALRQGAVLGSENWFIAEMVPGTHPLEELELALWPIAVDPPPSLVEPMSRDERGMLRTIRRVLPEEEGAQLLLIIDQFEELFTVVEDDDRRTFFIDSLLAAINAPRSPLTVVITLRADFYDRPLQYQPLAEWVRANTELVLPLNSEELTWAIREPARRVGVGMEQGLAEDIVSEVLDQPGALPLVQYTMTELFERRQDNILVRPAYEEIGGVLGALGGRAEEIYANLGRQDRELARQLFLRLVTLGEGVEDTRRRVLRSELEALTLSNGKLSVDENGLSAALPESAANAGSQAMSAIIDAFGSARLLTFDRDPITREPTVEVAHEALLREWHRLRDWLAESRNDVRMQRLLAIGAREWQTADHDPSYYLLGSRLAQFEDWATDSSISLTQDERAFLEASISARQQRQAEEEARRQRELETAQQLVETERKRAEEQTLSAHNLRRRAVYLGLALVVAVILAVAAVGFSRQSAQNANLAATRENQALTNAELAALKEAEALSEANQRATAQAIAEDQKATAVAEGGRADDERDAAVAAQATAQAETVIRTSAEAQAIQEREVAEQQAQIAFSRELAAAALLAIDEDPERSILLAMQALSVTHTVEAEEALHRSIQSSRVRQTFHALDDIDTVRVAINPQESWVFTSGQGGGVMWDAVTGEVVYTRTVASFYDYPPDYVTDSYINRADFSPDGSLLVLPNEEYAGDEILTGTITFLAADTGEELFTFPAHSGPVQDVTFNPEGTQLASIGLDSVVKVWDVAATLADRNGVETAALCCHEEGEWGLSAAFSPDGERLATGTWNRTVKMWDIATGSELFSVDLPLIDVVFSPDGRYVAVGTRYEGFVYFLDAERGDTYNIVNAEGAQMVVFSPDGTRMATASAGGTARVWDYADGDVEGTPLILSGHTFWLNGLAFSADGRFVVTGSNDRTARLWDVSTDGVGEVGRYAHEGRVWEVDFSPDGDWLASVSADGTAVIWDVAAREELFNLQGDEGNVRGLAIDPNGRTLATVGDDGAARIWDAQTGDELLRIQAHEVQTIGNWLGAITVDYSPTGDRLVTGGGDRIVRVWDIATGDELFHMAGHTDQVNTVAHSPDGRYIASGGSDQTIKVWDAEDGRELWTLTGDPTIIWKLAFSHDSSRLAVGYNSGEDVGGQVVVWQLPGPDADPAAEPEIALQFEHNTGWVAGVNFSPDDTVLSVPGLNRVSLHDAQTGASIIDLFQPAGANDAVFSPDGRMVALSGNDGFVHLMAANLEELLALADLRLTRTLTTVECQKYLHVDDCSNR